MQWPKRKKKKRKQKQHQLHNNNDTEQNNRIHNLEGTGESATKIIAQRHEIGHSVQKNHIKISPNIEQKSKQIQNFDAF